MAGGEGRRGLVRRLLHVGRTEMVGGVVVGRIQLGWLGQRLSRRHQPGSTLCRRVNSSDGGRPNGGEGVDRGGGSGKGGLLCGNSGGKLGIPKCAGFALVLGGSGVSEFDVADVRIPASLRFVWCRHAGEWKRADGILQHLVESMKASTTLNTLLDCSSCSKSCHNIPELPLSRYFTHTPSSDISSKGLLWGENGSSTAFNLLSPSNSFSYMTSNLGINTTTSASERSEISQLLDKNFGMFAISDTEKIQIHTVSDLLGEITDQNRASPYKTLDEAGRRFWIAVQFQRLYVLRRSGDSSSAEGCHLDSASIAWAFQSDCQDDLLDYVLPAESTWLEMQNLGMGLWYTNVSQLRIRMEKLARLQYLKSKDPKDCALLYIALNRIKVLVGLFKVSRNEKDKRLYEFLCRNFQEEKNKAAALKNAYVLLGRHQWELAIAFFLLGGDTSSAINVCAKNLQDEQLAMVICRLVEGSGGPLERNLISNVLLPDAVEKGDHWLSSLLEWMLGNYSQSVSKLFGCHPKLLFDESDTHGGQNVFADPELGQYCAILSTKNSFRNCAGEALSAKLSKLSFALAACALNRCGLPLEALECLSSKSSIVEKDGTSSQHGADDKILDGILNPFNASSNWLSSSVVNDVESELKVTMASNYLSRMLRNHFLCAHCGLPLAKDKVLKEHNSHGIEELAHDVSAAISIFHKRFSLQFYDVAEKSTSRLLLKHDLSRTSALDKTSAISTVIDLLDYNIGFSVSWLCHDIKALLIMSNPVLGASANDESCQVLLGRLMQAAHHKSHGISINTEAVMPNGSLDKRQPGGSEDSSLSIDEKWHLIGASLWIGLSSFMKHHLKEFIGNEKLECEACTSDVKEFKGLASSVAAKFVIDSLQFVSSSLVRLHASFFREKLSNNLHPSVLFWLEYMSSQPRSNKTSRDQLAYIAQGTNTENMEVLFHVLWEISANSLDICAAFVNEDVNCFPLNNTKLSRSWKNMVESTKIECENDSTQSNGGENKCNVSSKDNEKGRGFVGKASSDVETSLEPKRKCLIEEKGFQSPKELLRRNGELLEAICLNSTNEQHAAIATNRKDKKSAEYILSGSEWPSDGWACPETTPAATLISPSVGPGRRRGSHLGSDGANIGVGSLVKPGRDLTGGGAFGIPGYAGIGASGFGWGEPDEFEDFVDPPATLENIHSRALSRHPSLPLLLVGSSNTHVYLWEFGKDSARATYGVLPAANIPPPYALASISAVQFDYYGQRFATAALDGTICTWQVEVGGRSNVHPTESSLCFDSHASYVD
ncbi:DmX-like protein 1 [Triticum urartu]|uniref:DmX-like protein 1 n=1 Tax=Triticum urartu TaxID=4572 RepID=M7ZR71_TRIUA|nr:DmX-like protein 1 [Triticum urartu]